MLYDLSALYRGLGPQGQELIDAIFQQIRDGTVGQEHLQPSAVATP